MIKAGILILMIFVAILFAYGKKESKLTIKNIEIFQDTPVWQLAIALEESKMSRAKEILADGNKDLVNFQDYEFGTTLLMRAISNDNYQATVFLLENGANPNIISELGSTALFRAISYSWHDVLPDDDPKYVDLLLRHGADPNLPFFPKYSENSSSIIEYGTSPLMHAVSRGFEKVRLLVNHGAKIDYQTKLGTTAAIQALLLKEVEVAHYLIVDKKAKVTKPYYYYYIKDKYQINYNKKHYPISLLEDWLIDLNSEEHKMKMEIIEEFNRQGQNYWEIEKHPKTIERIKKIYPDNWKEYLQNY